jgi:cobalt-zinc-cadmium efflux system outer membrane protein
MSSNTGWQRVRHAAIAAVSVNLLGVCPSGAVDEGAEIGVTARAGETVVVEPRGSGLTLGDALALALKGSPNLASFSWETRAREAGALQAGLLPNPVFTADVENIGGSGLAGGLRSAETTLLLSQLVELGGKRAKRRSVGEHEVRIAEWEYEAARLEVIAETTAAFVDAVARQDAIGLAEQQIRWSEDVLRTIWAQVRSGAVSSAEVPRAELEVTKQRIKHRRRVRALRTAYVRLATAWGASEPSFDTVAGDLGAIAPIPLEAELVERMATTPELARWQAEVTKRRAAIALEDAGRIPDVTLGLGPRHFNDTNDWAMVVGVQVPIPVFDRNQGARQAARSRLSRSREEERSAALRLRRSLSQAYQELASASEEIEALRDEAIPTAERAYGATKRAQRQGAVQFTEVLDAQRSLFALRTQLVLAQASYHRARARTEALIGGPLTPEKDPMT